MKTITVFDAETLNMLCLMISENRPADSALRMVGIADDSGAFAFKLSETMEQKDYTIMYHFNLQLARMEYNHKNNRAFSVNSCEPEMLAEDILNDALYESVAAGIEPVLFDCFSRARNFKQKIFDKIEELKHEQYI